MKRRVEISHQADAEIEHAYLYIRQRSPDNAARWRQRLRQVADTLGTCPERCGIAPEDAETDFQVRQLLFGNYRILFTVESDTVYILHVRHGARRFMTREELQGN